MKKNMLIRIVSLLCVLTCLFAFASCHDDLATKEEVNNAQNTAKTDLTEAQKALYEAMDAVKATADAAATKAALEEVAAKLETVTGTADAAATKAALEEALAKLTEVEATANAAATSSALEEAKTALNAAIDAVKTTADAAATKAALEEAVKAAGEANTKLQEELDAKIAGNTTLINDKVTELQAAIAAVKATADAAATAENLNKVIADLAAVKTTADAAATQTALDKVVADLEALSGAAATAENLNKVIADLAAVKTTADAAATQTALDKVVADLEALSDAAATAENLNKVIADLAAVKTTADAAATQTALDAAEKTLNDALNAAKKNLQDSINGNAANIALNTSAITTINNTLATLATVENLNNVNAELAEVREIAEAAQTEAEVKAAITAAIEDLNLDDKLSTLKGDLQKEITDLETKLAADIKTNADEIAALKTEISNLKLSVGDKTEVTNLATRVAALEEALEAIDVDAFKNAYVALTEKLLQEDYEYAYSKFVAIVLDIDEGPYDPDEAKAVRLRAEDILFTVTRAVTEDGLADLYNELVEIKANLKTLEESLRAKVDAITSISISAESIQAVKDADKIYEKMVALEIAFEDATLKDEYLDIWNAYIELNGGTTKDETVSYEGYKNIAKKNIDDIVAKILGRDVKLGSTDGDIIDEYQAAIASLKTSIENSTHRDLYEAGLAEEVIAAVKAEVIAEDIAEMTAANFETYKANYRNVYIASVKDGFVASAKEAINAAIEAKKAELMAADDTLAENDALTQATAEVLGTYATVDEKAAADGEAAANADADTKVAEFETSANAQIATEAAAAAETDAGKLEIYVRAMAESLYNEDAAEAVAERYENMLQAAADAADLVNEVITIIGNWDSTGLLWNDTTAADAVAKVGAWVADAKYQSTNEAYIAAYAFCDDTITDANRDYVFGTYKGSIKNYAQLTNVKGYVEALKSVYDSYEFADVEAVGVEAFIVVLKAAINGVEVDGKMVLDVDSVAVDNSEKAITALDAAIKTAANNNAVATALNQKAMIGDIARNRIAVIKAAEGKLAAIITELKALYWKDGAWNVTDINAADTLDAFRTRIDAVYADVQADSTEGYVIATGSVTSSLAEDALNGAIASFNKYTEFAAQKYLEAKELIDELEALGAVKLNHGKRIYEVSVALKSLSTVITGMTYETRFPVDVDGDGTFEMVDFYDLQEKINNKYVPEYKALALEAETKADELKTAIETLVAKVGDNANKLDYYNEIVALMDKVEAEWLNYFYSDEMLAKAGATDDEVMAAIAAAVAATTDTKIIGGKGTTYAFLTSEAFAKLETITKTANATYATAKGLAEQWIKDAIAIVNGGSYTFHDWDKAGNNFKNIEERYNTIVATYYVVFDDTTDPDFGLYAAHETFAVEYAKCKKMAEEAAAQIKAIEDAIEALGALNTITLDNTVEKRDAVDAIKAAIAAFEDGYCDKAQEDGDIDADLLFTLAKYDGMVQVAEYWVSKKAEWPSTWNAVESFNVSIEAIDSSIEEAAEFGIDRYTALNNFIINDKSTVDKEISNAATANP